MKNQMEETMEHEIEMGIIQELYGGVYSERRWVGKPKPAHAKLGPYDCHMTLPGLLLRELGLPKSPC